MQCFRPHSAHRLEAGHRADIRYLPLLFILPLLVLLAAQPAEAAATYYVATNGSDSNPGTSSQPWQSFSKAWSVLAPGDTLIVRNGRYYQQIQPTVSGTPGSPITIRAETDGGVILDGQGTRPGISIFSQSPAVLHHITIEGLRVENCGENPAIQVASQDGTPLSGQSNNIVIRRTGARGDIQSSNNAVWSIARTRDSLLEDVWGWGEGRYVLSVYGCTNVKVRRGVFRWDGWGQGAEKPGDPKFSMGVYNTHGSLFENVLLLDASPTSLSGDKGALYVPGNANGNTAPYGDSDNNTFQGIIALNNNGHGLAVEGGSGGTNDNNRFVDLVSWGNSGHGVTVPKNARGTVFDHVTIGENQVGFYFGRDYNGVSGTVLKNSLVHSNTSYGINGPASTSYNNVYGNGTSYNGGAVPGPSTFSLEPLLHYILRIESDSPNKGTASDGGDRGATVVQCSVDGTLTAEALWPWPYEDRVRADLCESTTRGLCDLSWASLTDYVGRQLGHPWPPDMEPPTQPTNPALTSPTSSTLLFSWTASTDDVGVVMYRVDVSTDQAFGSLVPGYNAKDVGNVTQTQIAGLSAQTTYYARVRAYDAAGKTSLNSATAIGTTTEAPPYQDHTFQRGLDGFTGVTDTWINYYDPNLNFDRETKLNVQGTEDIKTLVRFDLSSIPAGTVIQSATLSLYNYAHSNSANGGTLNVHPVSRPWVESQATWVQALTGSNWTASGMLAGTDYATDPAASLTIDTSTGVWRNFDVTALVQRWIDGTTTNNGFVVRSPTRGAKPLFYSSAYTTDPSLRPRLTVRY